MTTALEHRVDAALDLSPLAFKDMVKAAHEKAETLKDIVEKAHLYVMINGKQYLDVQAWQTIGRAYGYTARTSGVVGIEETAINPAGVMARCDVYDANGTIVGGAEGWCMRDEETWAKRPFYALAGMAQTRATSRAFRQLLSWVVVLAGYAPTPAEEMTGDEPPLSSTASEYGICQKPEHNNSPFFKTGKMRSPAHRTQDGGWCNKPADKPMPPTPIRAESTQAPEQPKDTVDHWAALEPEARVALREMGYTTGQATTVLGAPLDAWLAADKLRTPAEAMRLLREAKTKQATKAGG